MIVLGIVGTPAGGKSTAAKILADFGAFWINADLIARECLGHQEVIEQLVGRWGTDVLDSTGSIDRAHVADLVFGSDSVKRENLQFLESVVHPRTRIEIRSRIEDAAREDKEITLLDVPLLFESGWDVACDEIWCVDATRTNRLLRSRDRGWDEHELDRREANQLPIKTKCRLSNVVMRNDSTLDALRQNLRCRWDDLVRIGSAVGPRRTTNSRRHCLSDRIRDLRGN